MGLMDRVINCMYYYTEKMQKDEPLPCPIHGIRPLVMVDITLNPHQGKVMCQMSYCDFKVVGEPKSVIRKWNKLCRKWEKGNKHDD